MMKFDILPLIIYIYILKLLYKILYYLLFMQDRNTFHRFDKFNSKYNPIGEFNWSTEVYSIIYTVLKLASSTQAY